MYLFFGGWDRDWNMWVAALDSIGHLCRNWCTVSCNWKDRSWLLSRGKLMAFHIPFSSVQRLWKHHYPWETRIPFPLCHWWCSTRTAFPGQRREVSFLGGSNLLERNSFCNPIFQFWDLSWLFPSRTCSTFQVRELKYSVLLLWALDVSFFFSHWNF